jgi:catechol 2,3-dioxygenase-like lactoylglutathione lyase family enzyme
MHFNRVIPEFIVSDLDASLDFYARLGFRIVYGRPENGFAFLEREGAQLMLDRIAPDSWMTGTLEKPFGRGVNLQIEADNVDSLYAHVLQEKLPLFRPMEEKWYRVDDLLYGNRQFLIQDPDGYLLRFFSDLGNKSAS